MGRRRIAGRIWKEGRSHLYCVYCTGPAGTLQLHKFEFRIGILLMSFALRPFAISLRQHPLQSIHNAIDRRTHFLAFPYLSSFEA